MSWLWKSDASSPAAFEKALSKLSTQITAASLSLETTRTRGRRFKALWTLYTTVTYLAFLLILFLVIGPQEWSIPHYGGLIGGPTLIYAVRLLIAALFNWRSERQQAYLNQLQKQRDVKVADLKKATKYDSTQELLQKYGGTPSQKETPTKQSPSSTKDKPKQQGEKIHRTGLPPPPTANIQGMQPQQAPHTPPQRTISGGSISNRSLPPQSPVGIEEPGFAPNAFPIPQGSRANYEQTSHWYDRILDVMLGEDENLAKNRLVLLCQNCKLVNGQAPPGVKTLEQLGKWRCGSCGSWNGTESEGAKVVREMIEQPRATIPETWQQVSQGDEIEAEEVPSSEMAMDAGKGTGQAFEDDAGVTKRVTRSAGQEPVEGL